MNWRPCTHGQTSNRSPKPRRRRDRCCSKCCTVAAWRCGQSVVARVALTQCFRPGFLTSISSNIGLEDPVVCAGEPAHGYAPWLPVSNTSRNSPEGSTDTGPSRRQHIWEGGWAVLRGPVLGAATAERAQRLNARISLRDLCRALHARIRSQPSPEAVMTARSS
jgi:hypothetical protein